MNALAQTLNLPRDKARVLLQDARAIELANKAAELLPFVTRVREYPLATDQDVAFLTDLAKDSARILDAVEDERKDLTRPIREDEKLVNEAFRPYSSALKQMVDACKSRIERYHAETRAQQAALQLEASKSFASGDAGRGVAIMAQVPLVAETPGVSLRDKWTYEVVNADLVPRELCSPDPAKIRAYVEAYKDRAQIPGVVVTKDVTVAVRR